MKQINIKFIKHVHSLDIHSERKEMLYQGFSSIKAPIHPEGSFQQCPRCGLNIVHFQGGKDNIDFCQVLKIIHTTGLK